MTHLARSKSEHPFAVTWPFEMPESWKLVPFKRLVRIRDGQVDPTLPAFADLPLYAPNFIESGTGKLLGIETAEAQGAISGKYPVQMGEILYSKIRPALRKATVAPQNGLCSADMYALRPLDSADTRFLFYSILSDGFSVSAELASDRVAMPKVNRDSLGDILLPTTDLAIQKKTADFLDRKTAAIDALIEKKRKLVELLQEYRQALITAAVTGQLEIPEEPQE